jgi:hypothetical protein
MPKDSGSWDERAASEVPMRRAKETDEAVEEYIRCSKDRGKAVPHSMEA